MNRHLSIEQDNRLLADMKFTYSSPLQGRVTIAMYRFADGDFGDLTPPVIPDYAIQQDFAHEHPLDSWAQTLAYDQELFRQYLQTLSRTDILINRLSWRYVRPAHLTRYLVLDGQGQTTGIIDAESGIDGECIRLRSLLGTAYDFEWFIPRGEENSVQKLFEDGKIADAKEIRNVG